jgi:hypothetical protein
VGDLPFSDAGLHRDAEGTNMIFNYVSGHKFCTLFEGARQLVLLDANSGEEVIDVKLVGNLYHMPRCDLTGAAAAFKAALTYLRIGSVDPEQHWVEFNAVLDGDA